MKVLGWIAKTILAIATLVVSIVSVILFGKSFDLMPEWARLFVIATVFMFIGWNCICMMISVFSPENSKKFK